MDFRKKAAYAAFFILLRNPVYASSISRVFGI